MEDAEELALLAATDFEQALRAQGPQEAAETLASYVQELRGAPQAVLVQLATSFRQHAAAAVAGGAVHRLPAAPGAGPALDLQPYVELQRQLLRVVAGCPQAEREVQEAWSDAAAALLHGTSGEPAEAAVDRLRSCTALLPTLLAPGSLRRLPAPADHQQRRSLLACLLHLRLAPPPGLPPGALEELSAQAVPPWYGSDYVHAKQQMGAAFEAFTAVMQHPCVRQHGGRHGGERQHPPTAGGQVGAGQSNASTHGEALRFLRLFRAPLPAITDLWWGHFAALLHSLVAAAQAGGPLVLRRPALQPLLYSLCCDETAHMVVQLLLAHPSYSGSGGSTDEPAAPAGQAGGRGRKRGGAVGRTGGREGGGKAGGSKKEKHGSPREALAMAAALLAHDVPAFLSGCCELLRPEANCPLPVQVEGIAAMDRAAGAYLDWHEGEEGASTRLWPAGALDHLLYALRSDPSIRVRRECMRLLRCVVVDVGSPQEAALLRAVVQRCRDKDDAVRQAAFALLVLFPETTLESWLSLADWQTLLDVGLAGPLPSGSSTGPAAAGGSGTLGGKAAAKHAAAIHEVAQQLLLRYLGLEGTGVDEVQQQGRQRGEAGRDFVPASDDEEEAVGGSNAGMEDASAACGEDARGSEGGSPDAWVARLEALRTLPPHADGCPMAAHLAAAWRAALAAVLSPEQQAAVGISGILEEAAAEQPFEEDGGDMWME